MDVHQLFQYGVSGTGLCYSTSYSLVPSVSNSLFGSMKTDIGNSPNSPFSTQFDCDTVTSLSDSQGQLSSTENPSESSPTCISTLESNSLHRLGSSVDCWHDSQPFCSEGTLFLQDAISSQNINQALWELEVALMAPDDEVTARNISYAGSTRPETSGRRSRAWSQEHQATQVVQPQPSTVYGYNLSSEVAHVEKHQKAMVEFSLQDISPYNLKQLLIACARALSESNMAQFDKLIEKARGAVSISGEPIKRLGAYMVEGLVARTEASGSNIYNALRCSEPEGKDLLSYMHLLYEICPYLKFGYMAANGAIADACKFENHIHIIDFQIAQGTQWLTLLQALAARPGGAPHVRITGIDDPVSKYARGDGLGVVARRLAVLSEKFNIPVEFHGVPVFALDVTRDMLDVRPGEALAVNFPMQLHHTPDESVDVNNPRDGLLRLVKSLSPKVVTLVEQESNTNTAPFLPRFIETLEYYLAMFESMDETQTRDRKERINVEQHYLARDIVNVIACEGKERVERHELLGKWKSRFTMAGFRQYPLSSYVNSVIRTLLKSNSDHYTLVEKDGAMLLGWKNRNLISASAWH
ncbi:hypothetical protein SLEP1_g52808 [Rubroshorea leprosula]|uniref:Uncharacterized protein n=1 Tax=Rubroshorea leprosula TaxID=152421 RepID=A0AAV5M7F4_9ROSI|nr:hypothetical protein SLEP1_g52808 [Rubroshorea leprosula]